MFEHLQDSPQIIVQGFRHSEIFDTLSILDEDELPTYSSEDSDIEEDDTNENNDEDVVQAMSDVKSSLTVSSVYTDSDSDASVDPIILSSSENGDV